MIMRFIVLFLYLYANTIVGGKSPRPLTKHKSDEPNAIQNLLIHPKEDDSNTPTDIPVAPGKSFSTNSLPLTGNKLAKVTAIYSSLQEEEEPVIEEKKITIDGYTLFRKLFVKQIPRDDITACRLHCALNNNEERFTITANKNIYVYSAITGEQERVIECKTPMTKARFISNDVLEVKFPPKCFTRIDVSEEDPIIINDTEQKPNDLWATIAIVHPYAEHYKTNELDIIAHQQELHKKDKLDYLIRGKKIIQGKKRWVTVQEDPLIISIYNMELYRNSEGYVSPDTPPPSPTNESDGSGKDEESD